MTISLPSFLKDLTDVIEMSSISDELKQQYLNLIEGGKASDEDVSLMKNLLILVEAEIKKREQQILVSGDSQMINQLSENKKALYEWQNEIEELALSEAEDFVEKVDEDSFVNAGLVHDELFEGKTNSVINSQEEQQDNSFPLSVNGIF